MTNQLSGQTGPSPRCYRNHERHDHYARVRHSQQFQAYLTAQATRLGSDPATIFGKVEKYGATRVSAAPNLAAIP
jgi:hypothetical protein